MRWEVEESVFFFEKKKQKTFGLLGPALPQARLKFVKVFWFFFSKKNALAILTREALAWMP